MKTAERILIVSLELFNQEGEANVSSVDIANELDISPGNLYYHYKGKEIIISALFKMYQDRMSKILVAPAKEKLTVEEFFYYLLLIFEASHLFRFLYRNPAEISTKYNDIAIGFSRMLNAKRTVFKECIYSFVEQGLIVGDANQQKQMVELMSLIGTQAPNYHLLQGKDINDDSYVYQSLAMILFALAPYLNIEREMFEALQSSIMTP